MSTVPSLSWSTPNPGLQEDNDQVAWFPTSRSKFEAEDVEDDVEEEDAAEVVTVEEAPDVDVNVEAPTSAILK